MLNKTLLIALVNVCLFSLCIADLPDVEIPDIDDITAIRDKCDARGGNGTYDRLKEARNAATTCLQGLIDFDTVKNELEEAKKTGSMDEVFGKYCKKRPQVKTCIENVVSQIKLCLNEDEQKAFNITLDLVRQLGEFTCFRDGDRIAMFVAEGGVECIKNHTAGIQTCVNSTFKIDPSTISTTSIPNLLIDDKKCSDLGKLQTCVVQELETCKESTPANIVDALFKFIKRSVCPKTQNKREIQRLESRIKRQVNAVKKFYNSTAVKTQLLEIFRKRCAENAKEGTFEILSESSENARTCISNAFKFPKVFLAITANEFKEKIRTCVQDFVETATTCLSEEEKYFPEFHFNSIYALIDFFFAKKEVLLYSPSMRAGIRTCFNNLQEETESESRKSNGLVHCFNLNKGMDDFRKEVVCGLINDAKECASHKLETACPNEVAVNNFFTEMVDAIASQCNTSNYT